MNQDKLIQSFQTTHRIIHRHTVGLTHEDSIVQPPFRSNCLNWVLGHIIASRDNVLRALNEPPAFSEAEAARYVRGSDPVTDDETAVPLPRLLSALDDAQERITAALQKATPNSLNASHDSENQQSVRDRIAGLHWHETYHVGQLEILRQVSGEREPFP